MHKSIANSLQSLRTRMAVRAKKYFKSLASTYSATQANAQNTGIFRVFCRCPAFLLASNLHKKRQIATKFHCNSIAIFFLVMVLVGQASAASWTDDWTVNGIPISRFRDAGPTEYAQLAAGVGFSYLAHWGSHVAYMESQDIDWHQDGLAEVYCVNGLSDSQHQWCGRSGFVGQLALGFILKHTPWKNSWLVTGYHIGTAVEVITYPASGCEDFDTIRKYGGNAGLEYGLYSLAAIYLLSPEKRLSHLPQASISD